MRDPHENLGVPWNADPRHIRAAYKKRAAQYHPDRNPAPDAADRLKEVIDAYQFLSNPARYVQEQREHDAPVATRAASVATAEFRRQQTFWYHFQKLISPEPSWWYLSHDTRAKLAIAVCLTAITLFLLIPMPGPFEKPYAVVGLLLCATFVIVVPSVLADIPVYTPRRGLERSVPDWLIETYGWIGLLSILGMMAYGGCFG